MIKVIFAFLSSVVLTLLHGFVLATLWAWFIVTTFGAPVLTIPVALGIYLLIRFITTDINRADSEREDAIMFNTAISYLKCLTTLAIGFVVKSFM